MKWHKIKARFLEFNWTCEGFGRPLTVERDHSKYGNRARYADHVRPLSRGGTHDWSNLRAYCVRCHSRRKTSDEEWEVIRAYLGSLEPEEKPTKRAVKK